MEEWVQRLTRAGSVRISESNERAASVVSRLQRGRSVERWQGFQNSVRYHQVCRHTHDEFPHTREEDSMFEETIAQTVLYNNSNNGSHHINLYLQESQCASEWISSDPTPRHILIKMTTARGASRI